MNNYYAIYYDRTGDGVVHDVSIEGGGGYGIAVRLSNEFNIANTTISGCDLTSRNALVFTSSDGVIVTDCEFSNNYYGIWINDVWDGLFTDNLITNTQSYAISVWNAGTNYLRILNNEMYYDTYGIYLEQADNVSISMNTIMYALTWGIFVGGSSSSDVNVTLNDVSNNNNGITMRNNGNSYVMNNTVMFNDGYGIYNNAFTTVEVYYNLIAFNLGDNGNDDDGGNYWDDGVDTGNWWSDYTPPGVYAVDGNTDDRYPMPFAPTEPIISQPPDVFYAEGDEGNEITWYVYDDSLRDWAVTIDGGAWEADAWNFVDITVNVDGLAYGEHTVEVTVWDIHNNNVTDIVIVHVFDDISPSISNEPNRIAFVDATGQVLSWEVYDLHPDTYTVFLDDEEFAVGTWTSGILEFNIDDIAEGEHSLLMQIEDIDGNIAFDQVLINVILDNVNPEIDSPNDITYIVGTTGNVIVWHPTDAYPATYSVATNSSTVAEGVWGGSRISVNVDGLSVGNYRFRLTVTDGSGNSAEDFVNVVVTPVVTEPPPPPPPIDLGLIGLIVAGVAGVIIIVVLVVVIRKRKAPY